MPIAETLVSAWKHLTASSATKPVSVAHQAEGAASSSNLHAMSQLNPAVLPLKSKS
jgi:hypothetical protein